MSAIDFSRSYMRWFNSRNNVRILIDAACTLIDDDAGTTLASASSQGLTVDGKKKDVAKAVGALVAERAKAAGVNVVSLDRNGYKYHGRVAALATGAREGGLEF